MYEYSLGMRKCRNALLLFGNDVNSNIVKPMKALRGFAVRPPRKRAKTLCCSYYPEYNLL